MNNLKKVEELISSPGDTDVILILNNNSFIQHYKLRNKRKQTVNLKLGTYPGEDNISNNPQESLESDYDILGLIYYVYKKNKGNMNVNFFNDKDIYKGEIGSFIFTKNEITHNLDIYQILNGQFSKVK